MAPINMVIGLHCWLLMIGRVIVQMAQQMA